MANIKKNTKYNILTPEGFKPFVGVREVPKEKYFLITLNNGTQIKCSDNHPFMLDGAEIRPYELHPGCLLDSTGDNIYVESIELVDDSILLYDIIDVKDNNLFIVDDIVSHNCSFLSSGNSVIDLELLEFYRQTFIKEPIEKRHLESAYWIWEYPQQEKQYIVCADVSRGDAKDYSALHVLDLETITQVAEYRGKIGTKEFGNFCVGVATDYNDAILVIENANIGWAAIQQVIDRQYRNLFYTYKQTLTTDPEVYLVENHENIDKSKMVPGFSTTPKNRPLMISKLEVYFREQLCKIQSKRLIDELSVFVWKDTGKAEAQSGYNDDLVMAFCIGLWVRDTAIKIKKESIDLTKISLGNIGTSAIYNAKNNSDDPYKMITGNNTAEDIRWLF